MGFVSVLQGIKESTMGFVSVLQGIEDSSAMGLLDWQGIKDSRMGFNSVWRAGGGGGWGAFPAEPPLCGARCLVPAAGSRWTAPLSARKTDRSLDTVPVSWDHQANAGPVKSTMSATLRKKRMEYGCAYLTGNPR